MPHDRNLDSRRIGHALASLTAAAIAAALLAPAPGRAVESARPQPVDRAAKLLDMVDDMWRGRTSRGTVSLHVKTKHYERTLSMEVWSKGKDYSLVRILSPRREKGTATLKDAKNIYTWLPRTARVIRLSSAMMGTSWMGSHFSNDDLVKESRMSSDYVSRIAFEGLEKGRKIIRIAMKPKAEAAVVWGKVTIDLDATSKLPIVTLYYDEKGRLARTMTFGALKAFGDRTVPSSMRLTPADKPTEFTEMRYDKLQFNVALDASFFSVAQLKRGR